MAAVRPPLRSGRRLRSGRGRPGRLAGDRASTSFVLMGVLLTFHQECSSLPNVMMTVSTKPTCKPDRVSSRTRLRESRSPRTVGNPPTAASGRHRALRRAGRAARPAIAARSAGSPATPGLAALEQEARDLLDELRHAAGALAPALDHLFAQRVARGELADHERDVGAIEGAQ